MIRTLRGRTLIWAATFGGLVLAGGLLAAFALAPAFRRADRALAPFEAILPTLAARQAALAHGIDDLAARLEPTTRPLDTVHYRPAAQRSLLSEYAGVLTPEAAQVLAEVEDLLAGLEAQLGFAWAALEQDDRPRARTALADVRTGEAQLAMLQRDQMILALRTGGEAHEELEGALETGARLGLLWLLAVALASGLLAWDLRRRVLGPIGDLQDGVERLSRGDWQRPVPEAGDVELRRLARHFNAMVEILRRRAGRQAQFATAGELLSGAAHELNNPLQAIRTLAEMHADEPANADGPDWAAVRDAAARASRLVRDLGRFTRTSRASALVHDLNAIVRSALDLMRFQFAADGIEVRLDLSERLPPALCDEQDMVQVFVNLLGNAHAAVRGRPLPRQVMVTSWREGDTACLRVKDSGPGVPDTVREHVFDPFFTTKAEGVGLGLPTARDVIEGEGGTLQLDPADGGGASFTIRLPAAPGLTVTPRRSPALGSRVTGEGSLEGMRVLVVDDEAAIRDVMQRFLEREGARPVLAAGGREALVRAAASDFDAVLLDLRMPDLDGASVYDRWVRERPSLAERTLILSGDLSRLDTATPVPPQRVLTKPIELAALRRALLMVGLST